MSNFNIEFYIEFKKVEYIVYLSVNDSGMKISMENSDCLYWLGEYPIQNIEEITQKAGSYKTFSVFVKMLMSALSQDNDSVTVDLLTNKDLEMMKQRRSNSMNESMSQEPNKANRVYLIVHYNGQFEKVCYPIPMYYQNPPSAESTMRTINRLKNNAKPNNTSLINFKEIEEIKQENVNLRNKVMLLEGQRKQGAVDNEENYRTLNQKADEYQNYKIKAEKDISYLMKTIEDMKGNLTNNKTEKNENFEKYRIIISEQDAKIRELEEKLISERKRGQGFVEDKNKNLEKVMKELNFARENEKRLKVRINQLEKEIEYQTKRNAYEINKNQKVKNMSSNRSTYSKDSKFSKESSIRSEVSKDSKSSLRNNLLTNPYNKLKDVRVKNYVSFFKTSNAKSVTSKKSNKSNTSIKSKTSQKSSTSSKYSNNTMSKTKITPKITSIPKKTTQTINKQTSTKLQNTAINQDVQNRLGRINYLLKTAKS
jgi:coiled-coil domain-containing protein 61